MKPIRLLMSVFSLVPTLALAPAAWSCDSDGSHIRTGSCSDPMRWGPRHDAEEARVFLTREDGRVNLVLERDVVAFQLSDRTMRQVSRKLRKEQNEDEGGALGRAIKVAVLSSVRSMIDQSAECRIRDLKDVRYDGERLVFITEDGERIFDGMEVDNQKVTEGYSERDAREFVREFRRLKARRG